MFFLFLNIIVTCFQSIMPGCASQASERDLCFYSLLGLRLKKKQKKPGPILIVVQPHL